MDPTNQVSELPYKIEWLVLYGLFAVVFLALFAVYFSRVLPDLRSLTPKLPGYQTSQIAFLIAMFLRCVGYLVWFILIYLEKSQQRFSSIFCGIPGYFMTVSYVLMFFLWCSISVNLLLNDSSDYFQKIGIWSAAVGVGIGCLGSTFMFCIFFLNEKSFHIIEMWLAISRDLISAIIISIFCIDIIRKLKKPLCNLKSSASLLMVMSIVLVISLICRSLSTAIYYFLFSSKDDENKLFGIDSYVNTTIGQLFGEIIPCFMIFMNRKKTGLLSVYDELT